MNLAVQITFRGMRATEALRAAVGKQAQALQRFSRNLLGCVVMIECAESHRHQGNRYRVHVHLKLPGPDVDAGRGPSRKNRSFEDAYVAIRDVFAAARRQLEDYERTRRGAVKAHETPARGQVTRIYKHADYGVLRTSEGRDIHFHRHSVIGGGFDALTNGSLVRFTEVPGEEGPWASTVRVIGKHHPPGRQPRAS